MRVYRALLWLYPAAFRHEYGGELAAVFRSRLRRATPAGRIGLCLLALPEVLADAAAAQWEVSRRDVRGALRSLRRSPAFTATSLLILAIGIGANTAVFSVADVALLRPLPFRDPDRLVKVLERTPGYGGMELSAGNYRDWKRMNTVAESFGTYTSRSVNLIDAGLPERFEAGLVSADLFGVLGVAPRLGRTFSAAEDAPDVPATILISDALWHRRFNADPAVLGRQVRIDDDTATIIGVMPATFRLPEGTELWMPQRFPEEAYRDRTDNWLTGVARLRPGITIDRAQADFDRVAAALERQFPRENKDTGASVASLRGGLSTQSRALLFALVGAGVCVLLIVAANLANLLLARALTRRREMAVRAAMGAGRERLVRQLGTESLVLAAGGGGIGVALAVVLVPLLAALVPTSLPIGQSPAVDLRVLIFAVVLTIAIGVAFGLAPVLRVGGVDLSALAEGPRAGGGAREGLRRVLVGAEVAASVILLVATGLLLRALWNVQATDPGFVAEGVVTLRTDLPRPRYDATASRVAFYDRILTEVRALPGVTAAGYISGLPLVRGGGIWPVSLNGEAVLRSSSDTASLRFVTPGYFRALGIAIRRGREIESTDTAKAGSVAVVSESLVRRYWPDRDPIGLTFTMAGGPHRIVGIAADVRVRGIERESEPQVYLSYQQIEDGSLVGYFPNDLAVRATGDAGPLAGALRGIIHRVDPDQPVSDLRTLRDIVDSGTATRALQLKVLGLFAVVAVGLAGIGLHGVLSFAVSQRTTEIGVRMAMGASPGAILRQFTREGAVVAGIGLAVGWAGAALAASALRSVLAGIPPYDPATFVAAGLGCSVLALVGILAPARRASRLDPVIVIRG